jgi:hypothetical protein
MTIQEVHVQRVNIVTANPFDTVVARIDAQSVIPIWLHLTKVLQPRRMKPKCIASSIRQRSRHYRGGNSPIRCRIGLRRGSHARFRRRRSG